MALPDIYSSFPKPDETGISPVDKLAVTQIYGGRDVQLLKSSAKKERKLERLLRAHTADTSTPKPNSSPAPPSTAPKKSYVPLGPWERKGLYVCSAIGATIGAATSVFCLDRIMRASSFFGTRADTIVDSAETLYSANDGVYQAAQSAVNLDVCDKPIGPATTKWCETMGHTVADSSANMGNMQTLIADNAADATFRGVTAGSVWEIVTELNTTFDLSSSVYWTTAAAGAAGGGFLGGALYLKVRRAIYSRMPQELEAPPNPVRVRSRASTPTTDKRMRGTGKKKVRKARKHRTHREDRADQTDRPKHSPRRKKKVEE